MKQIIIALFLLFIIGGAVSADTIVAPEWKEFCPRSYLYAKPSKYNVDQEYWYQRRLEFEETMQQASQYQGQDLKNFYEQVRKSENKKNLQWKMRVRDLGAYYWHEQMYSGHPDAVYEIQYVESHE